MKKIILFILMVCLLAFSISADTDYDSDLCNDVIDSNLWSTYVKNLGCGRIYEAGCQMTMYMKNTKDGSQNSYFQADDSTGDWKNLGVDFVNVSFSTYIMSNSTTQSYGIIKIKLSEAPDNESIYYYDPSVSGEKDLKLHNFSLYFNVSKQTYSAWEDGTKVVNKYNYSTHTHTYLLFYIEAISNVPTEYSCTGDHVGEINLTSLTYTSNVSLSFGPIPNQTINVNYNVPDNWIDLWDYTTYSGNYSTDINYSVLSQTNETLINCSITDDRYVNCTDPMTDQIGLSEVHLQVSDPTKCLDTKFNISVTYINSTPYINYILFSPEVVTGANQKFILSATDAEGDHIYNWTKWYVNNVTNVSWYNIGTLPSTNFNEDDDIILEIKIGDGYTNTSWANYTVGNVILINCSESDDYSIRFSFFNEESKDDPIITHIEFEGMYINNANLFNYEISGQNNYTFCMLPNGTSLNANLYLKFYHANTTNRYYSFNTTLDADIPQDVILYALEDGVDNAVLKITVRDKHSYQYLPNIVGKLQRKYIGVGEWNTVQMSMSDDYGLLLYNINEISTDYKIIFMDVNNNIIDTTDSMKFLCTADLCELVYLLDMSEAEPAPDNLSVWYKYNNETKNMTTYWDDPEGQTTFINTVVSKESAAGSLLICNLSSTSTSGNYVCNLNAYSGTIYFHTYGIINGQVVNELSGFFEVDKSLLGSVINPQFGALIAFIIVLSITMIGIFSPVSAVVASILGLIVVFYFGLLSAINITFVTVAIILAILVCIKLRD